MGTSSEPTSPQSPELKGLAVLHSKIRVGGEVGVGVEVGVEVEVGVTARLGVL